MSGFLVTARQAATTRADMSGYVAELHAAFLHVRAGDVDLHGVDGGMSKRRVTSTYSSIVEPETLAMKRVSEKSSFGRILLHHVIHARVLQADGVEHPAGVS